MSEIKKWQWNPTITELLLTGLSLIATVAVFIGGFESLNHSSRLNPGSWPALDAMLEGRIAFAIPDKMKQGVETKVTVRISANTSEDLTVGLRKETEMPKPPVTIEKINVLPHMTVKLLGNKAFEIVPLTPEEQFVAKDAFTQWQFNVTPLKSGEQELDLLVGVRVQEPTGDKETRFHPTYEHTVMVEVDRVFVVTHFFEENWKWIIGTMLFPVFLILLKRRFDNEKKKKSEEKEAKEEESEDEVEKDDDDGKGDD